MTAYTSLPRIARANNQPKPVTVSAVDSALRIKIREEEEAEHGPSDEERKKAEQKEYEEWLANGGKIRGREGPVF